MTTNKTGAHTAGPWKVVNSRRDGVGVYAANNPFGGEELGLEYPICENVNGDHRPEAISGRPEDNARLIAAAPQLLEALSGFVNDPPAHLSAEWFALCDKASATIRAATGGTP